jgi:hypothetical protein
LRRATKPGEARLRLTACSRKKSSSGEETPPRVRLEEPLHDLQDGRLPGAVPPHEAHNAPRIVLPRCAPEDVLRPEALLDVLAGRAPAEDR